MAAPSSGASSSTDGSTKFWGLQSGQETAEEMPQGFKFTHQGGKQKVNSYFVEAKGH